MNRRTFLSIKAELKENQAYFPEAKKFLKLLKENKIEQKLGEDVFTFLTTLRNRNLITSSEQKKLKKTVVAFFGLSVGSHAAVTWMMMSRANDIKISDPDTVSLSNLNRLKYGLDSVGKAKVDLVSEELKKVNPYCKIHAYTTTGYQAVNNIFNRSPKPHLIVDEMDDLKSKILVRKLAKAMKIPVIMATDVGENVFLDVERYDTSKSTTYFNGRVRSVDKRNISDLSPNEKMKIMFDIVGLDDNSERMLSSLLLIGKKIKTWPQLGSTATTSGGVVTTLIKKIALGEKIKSGRYKVLLESILEADHNFPKRVAKRKKLVQIILQP